jgi:DNA polymerase II
MAIRRLEGWLFDIDELGTEMVLWVYDNSRRLHRLTHTFHPSVYIEGNRKSLLMFGCELQKHGFIAKFCWTKKREFWSDTQRDVLELQVADTSLLPKLRTLAASREKDFTVYNIDINTCQYYFYTYQLFPLCTLEAIIDEENRVQEIYTTDDPYEIKNELPQLRVMKMWGQQTQPLNFQSQVILECDEETIRLDLKTPVKVIQDFNFFFERHDPDVILSKRGDGLLFPALFKIANQQGRKLLADRDDVIARRTIITEGRTFTSYGRVLYSSAAYPLRGRWHIDIKNSFFHSQTGLNGTVELARLTKIPVQRMARQSPGTAMSSIQLDLAIGEGTLINWYKHEPERYKTALHLLTVDKGGLSFQPPIGAFEEVAEIDYSSMYPTIMARHNISPETVLCSCCQNQDVPEALYNVCKNRKGLISRSLEKLIEQRNEYKKLIKDGKDERLSTIYDQRQSSIKWMLVSCFGYLGYKNSRFGRIEAHEAVTAYGREKLLTAKEIAESRGFRILHALTDSLWIKKAGATRDELLALCREITNQTEVEMCLEGIYRWIIFPPSKVKASRPVATRYYGQLENGKFKVRGLACRRRDTPLFIMETQIEVLRILSQARDLQERAALKGEIDQLIEQKIKELESGTVEPRKLALKRRMTREVDNYQTETRTAQAARQLFDAGVKVHAGENIKYVISKAKSKKKPQQVKAYPLNAKTPYDAQSYIELLLQAIDELYL